MPDFNEEGCCLLGRQKFYNSPIMSDVTVHFNGKSIAAHKIVLCLSSPYFTRLFDNDSTEAKKKDLHLSCIGDVGIAVMMRNIYEFEIYTYDWDIMDCVSVMNAAEKYEVRSTLEIAEVMLSSKLERAAELGQLWDLPDGWHREVAVEACLQQLEAFMKDRDFIVVLKERPELAMALLTESVKQKPQLVIGLLEETMKQKAPQEEVPTETVVSGSSASSKRRRVSFESESSWAS